MRNEMNKENYEERLIRFVDEIYEQAVELDWDWPDLAEHAGLSYNTVYRLGMRITQLPQLRTIDRLAEAVGMELSLNVIKKQFKSRSKTKRAA